MFVSVVSVSLAMSMVLVFSLLENVFMCIGNAFHLLECSLLALQSSQPCTPGALGVWNFGHHALGCVGMALGNSLAPCWGEGFGGGTVALGNSSLVGSRFIFIIREKKKRRKTSK